MPMTKKDFILIADCFRKVNEDITSNPGKFQQRELEMVQVVVTALGDALEDNYPRFQRYRWLDYINGECSPNGGQR